MVLPKSQPQKAYYSPNELRLFKLFQTREDFERETGVAAPEFDPARPPKHWFDPAAAKSSRRFLAYDVIGYAGKPVMEDIMLSREEAAVVNIPPSDWKFGLDQPVPVPVRPLDEDEVLMLHPALGPSVMNTSIREATAPATLTARHIRMIEGIAAALDVKV